VGIDVLGPTFEFVTAGLRVVSDGAGTAFELDTTLPVGAKPVKVGLAGAMATGLGIPGAGMGISGFLGIIKGRVSTHIEFMQLKPVGHGGCCPQFV
jgi:hypothetical protein